MPPAVPELRKAVQQDRGRPSGGPASRHAGQARRRADANALRNRPATLTLRIGAERGNARGCSDRLAYLLIGCMEPPSTERDRRTLTGILYALAAFGTWGLVAPVHFSSSRPFPLEVLAQRIVWSALFVLAIIGAPDAGRRSSPRCAPAGRSGCWRSRPSSSAPTGSSTSGRSAAASSSRRASAISSTRSSTSRSASLPRREAAAAAARGLRLGRRRRPRADGRGRHGAVDRARARDQLGFSGWIRSRACRPADRVLRRVALLLPLAFGYVAALMATGASVFLKGDWRLDFLLVATSVTTSAPLIWFAAAAQPSSSRRWPPAIPRALLPSRARRRRLRRAFHKGRGRCLRGDLDGARALFGGCVRRRARPAPRRLTAARRAAKQSRNVARNQPETEPP